MKKRKIGILLMSLLLITSFVLSGCSSSGKSITLACKPMTEQYIIAEMLTMLIEENTDIQVNQKLGIGGGTSNIHPGLLNGEIDMYPEYTGTAWLFVLKEEDVPSDPDELYELVKEDYSEQFNVEWSGLYGFNDTFGIAMKREMADEMDIVTYSDLAKVSPELVLGAEYDFYEREDGYPGLQEVYGFDFGETISLDVGLKYQAITEDEVDVINVFSTDGRLEEAKLVVLEDDKHFFPSYYAATLTRMETLETYPELVPVLEMLTGQISNDEMTYMNYLVEIEKQDPKVVAKDFLVEKGLLDE